METKQNNNNNKKMFTATGIAIAKCLSTREQLTMNRIVESYICTKVTGRDRVQFLN